MKDSHARLSAAALAAMALIAMLPPLAYAMGEHGSFLTGLWRMVRAFTITTNLLVGLVFLRIAIQGRDAVPPLAFGAVMVAIMLVGAIFNLLLDHMHFETVAAYLGDRVHHVVLPIAAPLWWLAFARKGAFRLRMAFLWTLYPLLYTIYLFARASFEPADGANRYIYFFLDVDTLGWLRVATNIGGLALLWTVAGLVLVWVDGRLFAARSRASL